MREAKAEESLRGITNSEPNNRDTTIMINLHLISSNLLRNRDLILKMDYKTNDLLKDSNPDLNGEAMSTKNKLKTRDGARFKILKLVSTPNLRFLALCL
jgi:hypothetical protein